MAKDSGKLVINKVVIAQENVVDNTKEMFSAGSLEVKGRLKEKILHNFHPSYFSLGVAEIYYKNRVLFADLIIDLDRYSEKEIFKMTPAIGGKVKKKKVMGGVYVIQEFSELIVSLNDSPNSDDSIRPLLFYRKEKK